MQDKIIEKLRSFKNIAILGFGCEGNSTYNFIRRYDKDMKLTIMDNKEINLDDPNVTYKKYNNLESELEEFDLIIKTPGISLKDFNSSIKNKITSQIELLLEVDKKNVIGITGTKGKSTTVSLLYKMFKDQKKDVFLVGNIGVPVLDEIESYKDGIVICEMSSHQLETVKTSPHIGIILNLFSDHLDHAGSIEKYHEYKMNINKYQDSFDYFIYDLDNYYLNTKDMSNIKSNILTVSLEKQASIYLKDNNIYLNNKIILNKNDIITNLKGDHNLKNILFTLLVASLYNLDINMCLNSIKEFIPLEHRMEYVGKYNDIDFYNDAIATIPEATINACNTISNIETLIFGGMDRGIDYKILIDYLNSGKIKNIICMRETGYKIADSLNVKTHKVETLEAAVSLAKKITSKDKACLLSPAAPSYNNFKNYMEKGTRFKELIKESI